MNLPTPYEFNCTEDVLWSVQARKIAKLADELRVATSHLHSTMRMEWLTNGNASPERVAAMKHTLTTQIIDAFDQLKTEVESFDSLISSPRPEGNRILN